jgi:hypothetical protein
MGPIRPTSTERKEVIAKPKEVTEASNSFVEATAGIS